MKKYFLLTLAALVSVGAFTSCKDKESDKGKDDWKNLPTTPIQSDNLTLDLNGATAEGIVTFTAKSNEAGQVRLQNLIDGYGDVTVEVEMQKKGDGSFDFKGSRNIESLPSRDVGSKPTYLTVAVSGNVSPSGKATVRVTTSGVAGYIGSYADATLKLTYGGSALSGKTVTVAVTEPTGVNMTLVNIIPGTPAAVLNGVAVDSEGKFSGTATTATAEVAYTGSFDAGVLTLNLTVTMNDTKGLAGAHALADLQKGPGTVWGLSLALPPAVIDEEREIITVSSGYLNFAATKPVFTNQQEFAVKYGVGSTLPVMVRSSLALLFPQVLQSVTLAKDGNITAKFSSDAVVFNPQQMATLKDDMVTPQVIAGLTAGRTWKDAPQGFAYWFEKDGKLYVKLDVGTIMAQAMSGSQLDPTMIATISNIVNQILTSDAATIKTLLAGLANVPGMEMIAPLGQIDTETLTMILGWVKSGFPLSVMSANGVTNIYLDNSMIAPLVTKVLPLFSEQLAGKLPQQMQPMLAGAIANWSMFTQFDLGISLK